MPGMCPPSSPASRPRSGCLLGRRRCWTRAPSCLVRGFGGCWLACSLVWSEACFVCTKHASSSLPRTRGQPKPPVCRRWTSCYPASTGHRALHVAAAHPAHLPSTHSTPMQRSRARLPACPRATQTARPSRRHWRLGTWQRSPAATWQRRWLGHALREVRLWVRLHAPALVAKNAAQVAGKLPGYRKAVVCTL